MVCLSESIVGEPRRKTNPLISTSIWLLLVGFLFSLPAGLFAQDPMQPLRQFRVPLAVQGIAIAAESSSLVVWGFESESAGQGDKPAALFYRVVNVTTNESSGNFPLNHPPLLIAIQSNWIVFCSDQKKVMVANRSDLSMAQSFVLESQPLDMKVSGDILVVQSSQGVEVYSLTQRRLIRTQRKSRQSLMATKQRVLTPSGNYVDPCLYDDKLDCKLIVASPTTISLTKPSFRSLANEVLNTYEPLPTNDWRGRLRSENYDIDAVDGHLYHSPIVLPGNAGFVELRAPIHWVKDSQVHKKGFQFELLLDTIMFESSHRNRQVLIKGERPGNTSRPIPLMVINDVGDLVVAVDSELICTRFERLNGQEPLAWDFQQSAFVLDSSGSTRLRHSIRGGKLPYRFAMHHDIVGITLSEDSGDITVDNEALKNVCAMDFAKKLRAVDGKPGITPQDILGKVVSDCETLKQRVGIPLLVDLPISVPIDLSVCDAANTRIPIRYFVIATVPLESIDHPYTSDELTRLNHRISAIEKEISSLKSDSRK